MISQAAWPCQSAEAWEQQAQESPRPLKDTDRWKANSKGEGTHRKGWEAKPGLDTVQRTAAEEEDMDRRAAQGTEGQAKVDKLHYEWGTSIQGLGK